MQRWHGLTGNSAFKAVSHYQVESFSQLLKEPRDVREVIAIIGITHQYVLSPRRRDSGDQSAAIPPLVNIDQPSAQTLGDLAGIIRAAIVGNNDFSHDVMRSQCTLSFLDAGFQRLRLVETWHHYR